MAILLNGNLTAVEGLSINEEFILTTTDFEVLDLFDLVLLLQSNVSIIINDEFISSEVAISKYFELQSLAECLKLSTTPATVYLDSCDASKVKNLLSTPVFNFIQSTFSERDLDSNLLSFLNFLCGKQRQHSLSLMFKDKYKVERFLDQTRVEVFEHLTLTSEGLFHCSDRFISSYLRSLTDAILLISELTASSFTTLHPAYRDVLIDSLFINTQELKSLGMECDITWLSKY